LFCLVAAVAVAVAVVAEKYYTPVFPKIVVDIKAVRSVFTQILCFLPISHKKLLINLATLILSLFIMTLKNCLLPNASVFIAEIY
jgi:hypothetical protein